MSGSAYLRTAIDNTLYAKIDLRWTEGDEQRDIQESIAAKLGSTGKAVSDQHEVDWHFVPPGGSRGP